VSNERQFSSILSVKNKLLVLQIVLLGSILAGTGYSIFALNGVDAGFADNVTNIMMILIGVSIGTFALITFFAHTTTDPIKNAAEITKKISEGDLNVKVIRSNSTREISDLTNSLDNMVTSLRQLVMDVKETANKVARDARESAAASEQLNASVEEVSTTVQQIATGSQSQASELAEAKTIVDGVMDPNSKEGETAADKMSRIIELTNQSSIKVKNLAEKSEKITSVVEVIREISEKTNLLALNAAIEAARAGESGRGFAVVADEVRRLAEGSAKSLEEIDKLIGEIQEDIHITVASIDDSAIEIEEGRSVVDSSLNALSKISNKVQEVAAVAEENAFATDQAYAAVEQQTTATQEISSSSQNIAIMAEELARKVSSFKVPSNDLTSNKSKSKKSFTKNKDEESSDEELINEFQEATGSETQLEEKIES
jgi:methyl-accepting chemotaxis protein